jgi:hypothetical protein
VSRTNICSYSDAAYDAIPSPQWIAGDTHESCGTIRPWSRVIFARNSTPRPSFPGQRSRPCRYRNSEFFTVETTVVTCLCLEEDCELCCEDFYTLRRSITSHPWNSHAYGDVPVGGYNVSNRTMYIATLWSSCLTVATRWALQETFTSIFCLQSRGVSHIFAHW